MRIQNLLCSALLLAGTAVAAAERPAVCDFTAVPPAGVQVVGNLPFTGDTVGNVLVFGCEPNQNKGVSGGINVPLTGPNSGILVAECPIAIANTSPKGHGQVSGRVYIDFCDRRGKVAQGFSVGSKRYHHDRDITFSANGRNIQVPFVFVPEEPMTLRLILNRPKALWRGEIIKANERIFTTEDQPLAAFVPARLRVVAASVNKNDGMKITVAPPAVKHYTPREFAELERHSDEYCSTLPRQYKHVNPALYNSGFGNISGHNNSDRIALCDPAAADARARELSELGFTAVLYSGRHFRANYLEEFPLINEAGRIIGEACKKYGISVIEHHDPTIMSYRGYPFMLSTLDWLQRDIRSGESTFWYCPGNDTFMAYLLNYLRTLQSNGRFAGFMIDELNLAGRNFDGCDECRAAYAAETGDKPPVWLNHQEPSPAQRKFRSWGMRMTNRRNNLILNEMQKIKPDTIIMTYCSDYADSISQTIDLAEAAAMYSPFVGWENMVYDPLESHTSLICNLKMRNSYGDFYNIPVWSLNREAVSREAHYLEWAFCQGTRHSVWYGSRLPLDTPENRAYFTNYSRWPKVMPHRYARTFTDTGVLLSLQTWRTTADRRFYWEDFRGTLDTYIRSSRQFDTLLDGDLFYPGRLGKYKVLVLPSQASLSDRQCRALEDFVRAGGTAILTNNTSLYDARGNRRVDFALGRAANIRWTPAVYGKGQATSKLAGTAPAFDVPFCNKVELIRPGASRILVEYTSKKGEKAPLLLETAYGKGRFLYLAAPLGRLLYELEMRNGRAYNYRPAPALAALVNAVYDEAHQTSPAPVSLQLPDKVLGIANQLQDGDGKGDLYIQLYNLTGSKIKAGDKRSYGVPENITFPPVSGDLKITVNTPCAATAVLESPERPDAAIAGVRDGDRTVFTVPGKLLGGFAQLKVAARVSPAMKILEPPMAEVQDGELKQSSPPAPLADLYEEPVLNGRISDRSADGSAAQGFGWTADGAVTLDGRTVIAAQSIRQSNHEYKDFLRSAPLIPAVERAWSDGGKRGVLASGKLFQGAFPWVRETVRGAAGEMEISLAGTLLPGDYTGLYTAWAFRIPAEQLRGATGRAWIGMHRSGRAPRRFRVTGKEADGAIVCDSIRSVQFTGGAVDFSIDFATMGPWGLFIEDLCSQYKAHLIREGGDYWFILPAQDVRFGIQFTGKVILRSGVTDFDKIHPQGLTQYQYNRPVTARLQFTPGPAAQGFKFRKDFNFHRDFSPADMKGWSKPEAVKLTAFGDAKSDPLFFAGAVGKGENSYTFAHDNCIALANVLMNGKNGAIAGTVRANGGKAVPFDVPAGEFRTLLLPVRVTDGKVRLDFTGSYAVSGVVMQPLLFPAEDFLWSRSFWNCGKAPWLLPELQCDPKDWRFRSDVHLRKARWLY